VNHTGLAIVEPENGVNLTCSYYLNTDDWMIVALVKWNQERVMVKQVKALIIIQRLLEPRQMLHPAIIRLMCV